MRRILVVGLFILVEGTCGLIAARSTANSSTAVALSSQQTLQAQPLQNGVQTQQAPPTLPQTLQVIVLDPAHGGSDAGARGANGMAEKDIVLEFARETEVTLRAEGFQVVLTRQGDTDPSSDDRATIANAQTNAIFISLHVASTGSTNTVRTYTYLFPAPVATATSGANSGALFPVAAPTGFLVWGEAQEPFISQSRKLGDLLQAELAKNFKNSPDVSWSAPVYGLRSVAAPAVAIELSSVAANPQQLEAMAAPLAQGIARAVAEYKAVYPPGGR